MKKMMLLVAVLMLATLVWAAQQPGSTGRSGGQATPPSSQIPDASQPRPSTPGSADQDSAQTGAQAGSQVPAANAPITEGCLGGSNPNYTITDKTGTTYKLNLPPGADASSLTPHVGESVQVLGDLKNAGTAPSIDVSKIGRGNGKCPASGSTGAQPPPKQ
jgi:hypothetical protein